jgi:AcrR family transcriptional regulator
MPEERLFDRDTAPRRKRPRQSRSQMTVDRIKRATLTLIAQEGYAAASTNRIAELAEVNISSLYQYFPNKQAIALALYEDTSSQLAEVVHRYLVENLAAPLEDGVASVVGVVVDFLDKEQATLLRLADEVPALRDSARAMSLENLAAHTSRMYLHQHLGKLKEADLGRKMFFVQNLSMGLIRRYVLERPAGISKARFVTELSDLLVGYLRR